MKSIATVSALVLCAFTSHAVTRSWTNSAGGNWFILANWSPNGVPNGIDVAFITNNGTYIVTIPTNAVNLAGLTLGGSSGTQTLINGTASVLGITNAGLIRTNGVLSITNGGLTGNVTVQAGGTLTFDSAITKTLYSLNLRNQGTMVWSGGFLANGGNPTTAITNLGVWDIQTDNNLNWNSGPLVPRLINQGTIRKSAGVGTASIFNQDFTQAGFVDVQSGILNIGGSYTNILGGAVNVNPGAGLTLSSGNHFDSGGVFTNSGAHQMTGGTLTLRTNFLPGLSLDGGTVQLGTGFQQAGIITNLVINGATLVGTNRVGNGFLTVSNGGLTGQLTVQAGGVLNLAGASTKTLYSLDLRNLGTINWTGGFVADGGNPTTIITNSGVFDIQIDNNLNWNSGPLVPRLVNQGVLRKSAGSGTSSIFNQDFLQTGFVDVQIGTLNFGGSYTNILGGAFNVNPGAALTFSSGFYFDSGAVFTNSGLRQLTGGTLTLRTNFLQGLSMDGGTVVLGPNFQQAGAITNFLVNGSTLSGTNRVGTGFLTVSNGALTGQLIVQPGGILNLAGIATKTLYSLDLRNFGTVNWTGGFLADGGNPTTIISNIGLWDIQTDNNLNWNSGPLVPRFVNQGTLRKSAGAGTASIFNQDLVQSGFIDVQIGTLNIGGSYTNYLSGAVNVNPGAAFTLSSGFFFDSGGVFTNSGVHQMTGGTITLNTNFLPGLSLDGGTVLLGTNFQQAGVITNLVINGATLAGTNRVGNGFLTASNGALTGQLTVQPGGALNFAGANTKTLYSLDLRNFGIINWTGGFLADGGNPVTVITNAGLWDIQTDNNLNWNSGPLIPRFVNEGTLRKSAGPGTASIFNQNFFQTGFIDVQIGALNIGGSYTNILGGAVNVNPGAAFTLNGGVSFDSGAVFTNSGLRQLTGGTLTLRTNVLPGLSLDGGTVLLGPGFQQAGNITNLIINGATLAGTNQVGNGSLTVSNGALTGQLTVQAGGTLAFAGANTKTIYGLDLRNFGTILWTGGFLADGGNPATVITNAGVWEVQTDNNFNWNSGSITPRFVNRGILRKTAGAGTSGIFNQDLSNESPGLIQADLGALTLPSTFTNTAGTLRLNGGTLQNGGATVVNGGTLDGSGGFGSHLFTGGFISPGLGGNGLINFPSGLNLRAGTTLTMSGSGTAQGAYDQLSVVGSVNLSNATLQVTSLPSVPVGTTFIIITNDGVDAVQGTFAGLPENSPISISGQQFVIHYAGGTGNDVTLVRSGGSAGAQLMSGGFTNGNWRVLGLGNASTLIGIQATTNFINWTNIGTATSDGSGNFIFIDSNAVQFKYRFYRTTN